MQNFIFDLQYFAEAETAADAAQSGAEINDGDADRTQTNTSLHEEFERLIGGEYKSEFDSRVQSIINRRFKEQKALTDKLNEYESGLNELYERYGVDSIASLNAAVSAESDVSASTEDADDVPYSALTDHRIEKTVRSWLDAEVEMKKTDPGFCLAYEIADERFQSMLKSGLAVSDAYRITHYDELIEAARNDATRQTVDTIRARGQRPAENGASSHRGVHTQVNVSSLTAAQRRDAAKRASHGESIDFRRYY